MLLLGILQGLTEFLPVSSSGHLVIAQHYLKIEGDVLFLDTLLHVGTLGAVLAFFFRDIRTWLKDIRKIGLVLLVTLITGLVGISFRQIFESAFSSVRLVSFFLIINGLVLLATRLLREKNKTPDIKDSIVMGLAQGIAIIPGLSRSGSTISALLCRGIGREEAFRFSFIASIPAILGAFLFELKYAHKIPAQDFPGLILGIAASFVVGLIALHVLAHFVKSHRFHLFGYYCLALGTLSLGVDLFRKFL